MNQDLDSTLSKGGAPARRTVNAFFDTQGAAQQASEDLIAAGIPRADIAMMAGQGAARSVGDTVHPAQDKGFWQSLKDLFLPEPDESLYAEGLRRGGFLLSVRTDDASYDHVLGILDRDGAVDLDDRATHWRSEGWSGLGGDLEGVEMGQASRGLFGAPDRDPGLGAATAPASAADASIVAAYANTGQASAPMVRPTGSRDLSHGRARVRGYVDTGGEAVPGSFSAGRDTPRIIEHMEVIASDGQAIGTVDHLDGPERIKLARSTAPDGQHHFVPLAWIDHVDAHVHLNRTAAEAKAAW